MDFLPDPVLAHLRDVLDSPALEGTRYTAIRELGRGGTGIVWAVRDQHLDRIAAMKVAIDSQDQWLLDEARAAAQLDHPGIVPVHDSGRLPDGRAFYVMKLVEGTRFDRYVAQAAPEDGLRALLRVCDAVAFAHSRGRIHRDLKPANIMTGAFGEVFVLDWGIAVEGTPGYAAPEGVIDARSDIYSLGAILAAMPAAKSKAVRAIATQAQAPDPRHRYPEVPAFAADITRYLDHQAVTAYRENLLERARRYAARNPELLLLITAYVLVRFGLFFWQGR